MCHRPTVRLRFARCVACGAAHATAGVQLDLHRLDEDNHALATALVQEQEKVVVLDGNLADAQRQLASSNKRWQMQLDERSKENAFLAAELESLRQKYQGLSVKLQSPGDVAAEAKLNHLYTVVADFLSLLNPDPDTPTRKEDEFKVRL